MRPNRLLFWTDSKGYLRLRSFYAVYLTFKTLLTGRFYFNVIPHGEQQTVFDQITESPETLVRYLVYGDILLPQKEVIFKSTLFKTYWRTKAEAIAATLAILKEVTDNGK